MKRIIPVESIPVDALKKHIRNTRYFLVLFILFLSVPFLIAYVYAYDIDPLISNMLLFVYGTLLVIIITMQWLYARLILYVRTCND